MTLPAQSLRIRVNGQVHEVAATPDTPLLYVLRNDLRLNAAKYGCGLGRCGACTVHLDGTAVHACEVPVGEVAGRAVTTLEGLGNTESLHPLQQAFLDEQAAQCGYCIPGMLMAGAKLLEEQPAPDLAAIQTALSGNICRCTGYRKIFDAVLSVEAPA